MRRHRDLLGVYVVGFLLGIILVMEITDFADQPVTRVEITAENREGYLTELRSQGMIIAPDAEETWVMTGRAACLNLPRASEALADSGWRSDQVYVIVTSAQHHLCRITK